MQKIKSKILCQERLAIASVSHDSFSDKKKFVNQWLLWLLWLFFVLPILSYEVRGDNYITK